LKDSGNVDRRTIGQCVNTLFNSFAKQDMNKAISVMYKAGKWLQDTGKNPSKWWQPENLNKDFLLNYAKPEEFFVAIINNKPAAVAILQLDQKAQDWFNVDKGKLIKALYIHWLCVDHIFAGKGMPKLFIDFANNYFLGTVNIKLVIKNAAILILLSLIVFSVSFWNI